MRFSICYRVVRLKGFFWGRRLFFYRRRFAGYLAPIGAGKWPRAWFCKLADGFLGFYGYRARLRLRGYAQARLRNAGYVLLRYLSPQFEAYWPSV